MNAPRGTQDALPISPPVVLVCFALEEEAAPFRALTRHRADVRTLVTGIGRQNAERALRAALAESRPAAVLSCGYAGALHPDLKPGTVVFSADASSPGWRTVLLTAGAREVRFHCSDRVAATAGEKRTLRQETGADAVEMESEVIRSLCHERGIPSATVRVISDAADTDLPLDFNLLMTADQRVDQAKLIGAIFKSPARVPALLRLRRQCRSAAARLAHALVAALRH